MGLHLGVGTATSIGHIHFDDQTQPAGFFDDEFLDIILAGGIGFTASVRMNHQPINGIFFYKSQNAFHHEIDQINH
jgi:hypothetical protein